MRLHKEMLNNTKLLQTLVLSLGSPSEMYSAKLDLVGYIILKWAGMENDLLQAIHSLSPDTLNTQGTLDLYKLYKN